MEQRKFEITLPDPERPGEYKSISEPLLYEEALAFVQETYGADEEGRVCLINPLPDDVEKKSDEE